MDKRILEEIERAKRSTESALESKWSGVYVAETLTKEQKISNGEKLMLESGDRIRELVRKGVNVKDIADEYGTFSKYIYARMTKMVVEYFGDDLLDENDEIDSNSLVEWVRDGAITGKLMTKTWGRAVRYIKMGASIKTACELNDIDNAEKFLRYMTNRGVMEIGGREQFTSVMKNEMHAIIDRAVGNCESIGDVAKEYGYSRQATMCIRAEYLRERHDSMVLANEQEFRVCELLCNGKTVSDIQSLLGLRSDAIYKIILDVTARTWDKEHGTDTAMKILENSRREQIRNAKEASRTGITKKNISLVLQERRKGSCACVPGMKPEVYSAIVQELRKRTNISTVDKEAIKDMVENTTCSLNDIMFRLVANTELVYAEFVDFLVSTYGKTELSDVTISKLVRLDGTGQVSINVLNESIREIRSNLSKSNE